MALRRGFKRMLRRHPAARSAMLCTLIAGVGVAVACGICGGGLSALALAVVLGVVTLALSAVR